MSTTEKIIDVYAATEFQQQIIALAKEYQIQMTDFEGANPTIVVSTFPTLDPTVVEAIKEAILVVTLGIKGTQFISALTDLVNKAGGRVKAIDRSTNNPIR
jgi:hypothetical protein